MDVSVSTLILAGGKSSRMGQDKALLRINGQPLLTKIYHLAQECTNKVYVVTSFPNKYTCILPSNCCFIQELIPFSGPLIAVANAIKYLNSEWILLLACDLPLLTVMEVKTWLTYLPTVSKEAVAFLPTNAKGWECLCGFYRRDSLASISNFIAEGNTSLQKWLKNQIVEPIPLQNTQVLFNCNTIADYQNICDDRNLTQK